MNASMLGTLKYYQQTGQPYADLVKEALKPALGMTAVTKYLGASVLWAVGAGLGTVVLMLTVSVVMGWLVVKYQVIHAAIRADWKNNPLASRQIELLEEIAKATQAPKLIVVS